MFKLPELLSISDPLLLFLLDLLVQLLEYFVEAREAHGILHLEAALLRYVGLNQVPDQKVAVCFLAHLREHIQVLVRDLSLLGHSARDLRGLDIDHIVKVLRVFQGELIVKAFNRGIGRRDAR